MIRKSGRPLESTEAREKLLICAGELFTSMSYEQVSTRLLADKAGVNVAMIRYYFGNKEGLFEAMVRGVIKPVEDKIKALVVQSSRQGLLDVMQAYYMTMLQTPRFPKLVLHIMNLGPLETRRQMFEGIFVESLKSKIDQIFNQMLKDGVLRSDMDPVLCRFTFLSLMIFPFAAPTSMLALNGIELNEAFLIRLLEHNRRILSQGFFEPEQSEILEQHNEN